MEDKPNYLVLGIILVILFVIGYFALRMGPIRAEAKACKSENAECDVNKSDKLCCAGLVCMDKGVPSDNGKCQVEPTATPTPTVTPTPTPTIKPDKVWCHEIKKEGECKEELKDRCDKKWLPGKCEPEETPTPEVTPVPVFVGSGVSDGRSDGKSDGQGEYHPALCGGVYPDRPILQGFKVIDSTTDEYSWWAPVSGIDKYAVVYGYKPDELVYGIDNIPNTSTSVRIGNLRPNTQSWLQVWAFKGECMTKSDIFN